MYFKTLLAAVLACAVTACDTVVNEAETSNKIQYTGIVKQVDQENRLFQIESRDALTTFKAGPQVVNFDNMAVGDKVKMEYVERTAVSMASHDDDGEPLGAAASITAPEGAKPGVLGAGIETVVVEFLGYDRKTKIATLRTSDEIVMETFVPRDVRKFAKARTVGDRIVVAMEQAVAVSVTPTE